MCVGVCGCECVLLFKEYLQLNCILSSLFSFFSSLPFFSSFLYIILFPILDISFFLFSPFYFPLFFPTIYSPPLLLSFLHSLSSTHSTLFSTSYSLSLFPHFSILIPSLLYLYILFSPAHFSHFLIHTI